MEKLYAPTAGIVLYTIAEMDMSKLINVGIGDIILGIEVCKSEVTVRTSKAGMCKILVIPGENVGQGQEIAEIY